MKILTLGILLAGTVLAPGGELSDCHDEQAKGKQIDFSKSRNFEQILSRNHGITEMGIERTSCFGTCPVYTFIIRSDGTFRYKGFEYVQRKGAFTGKIPESEFHTLAQFIKDSGYFALEQDYYAPVTDNPTVYTTVVMNGKRKCICNYANAGPTRLWAIEQLIDALLTKATWDPPRKKPDNAH